MVVKSRPEVASGKAAVESAPGLTPIPVLLRNDERACEDDSLFKYQAK
ncbi:MAG: hypothetical protein HY986_05425 [Candidatus Melainabacteria bacterium]|nr:hypothetical protein [Candidatus Melainabacteria bacterium]